MVIKTTGSHCIDRSELIDEDGTGIDGDKVTSPQAVCHSTDQRDGGLLEAVILRFCVGVDAPQRGIKASLDELWHISTFDIVVVYCYTFK